MNEKMSVAKAVRTDVPVAGEFGAQVEMALKKCAPMLRPFFVVLLQIDGFDAYRSRRSSEQVNHVLRDIHACVRRAVHPSQYVGVFRNGLGLVFDAADTGQVDVISMRLSGLCQQAIRAGGYNDIGSSWSDVLFQFLAPAKNSVLVMKVGWAIYPRDGATAIEIVRRAWNHLIERSR